MTSRFDQFMALDFDHPTEFEEFHAKSNPETFQEDIESVIADIEFIQEAVRNGVSFAINSAQ